MSGGLSWVSYNSDNTLNAGGKTINNLYNNAITFFSPSRTLLASGSLNTLQVNNTNENPSFSTFTLGATSNIAIKLTGFICPPSTSVWTVRKWIGS